MGLIQWVKRLIRREPVVSVGAETDIDDETLLQMDLAEAYEERDDLIADIRRLVEAQKRQSS